MHQRTILSPLHVCILCCFIADGIHQNATLYSWSSATMTSMMYMPYICRIEQHGDTTVDNSCQNDAA